MTYYCCWCLDKTTTSINFPNNILMNITNGYYISLVEKQIIFWNFVRVPWEGFFYLLLLLFFTLQYCIGLPYINMHPPGVYTCSPSWTPLPPPSPYHTSGSSQCTSPKLPVSCIKPGLAIHFLYYTCFNAILPNLPPSPSATESKRLFYTSLSLLLSHIQGCHYHLSKFHIYALVYCIGVFC